MDAGSQSALLLLTWTLGHLRRPLGQSDESSQHLSAEEKACLTFLEETIESIVTEDNDAQSSGDMISKNHHITHGVHQDRGDGCESRDAHVLCVTAVPAAFRSSCNSFPVTGSSQDLSTEEKACLKMLDETINSIEDGDLSTDDAPSLSESRYIIAKKRHINQMKNYLVPTPLVLAASIGNIPPKQGTAFPKEKSTPNKDNNQPSSDDASRQGLLSHDGQMELCKCVSMTKTSVEKHPFTHGDQKYSQNISETPCSKLNPPAVAPKPKEMPSHLGSLYPKGNTIPNPDSNLPCLSTSPEKCGLVRPDKTKLEALSKLGLLKDEIPENKQGLEAPLSSSCPDWPQKDQLEKSGMKFESSVSNDEQAAHEKLSHTLSLSLPMHTDIDEDRRWALRKLGLLKD